MTAGLRLRKQNLGCVRVVMCHSDREPVHTRARRSVMNDGGRLRLSIHIVGRESETEREGESEGAARPRGNQEDEDDHPCDSI